MAPNRPKQRASDAAKQASPIMVPVSTPTMQRSPIKQRKMGISVQQKQALIDNLQLEITERARRLRAQYNLQAQGLRLRIEVRVGRIPTSLRKMKMEDLLLKYAEQQQRAAQGKTAPPVPAKDVPQKSSRELLTRAAAAPAPMPRAGRPAKRTSDGISHDKENEIENMENPKKKPRGQAPDRAAVRPGQVLSPTSSNSRLNNIRPESPTKSQIARPGSPLKGASRSAIATSMLSNIVEKAKSSRVGTRKVTTTSNTSSSSAGMPPPPAPATRTRRAAAPAAPKAPPSRPATRLGRRASLTSEASDGSTSTVVRKTATSKTTTAATKRKGLASFTKGTASGDAKKTTAAAKPAAPTTTRAGRVLRNRG